AESSAREAALLGSGLPFVLIDRPLQDADDQGVQRGLVFLRPARQLFMQGGRHADLKVDHGFWHRCNSSRQGGGAAERTAEPTPPGDPLMKERSPGADAWLHRSSHSSPRIEPSSMNFRIGVARSSSPLVPQAEAP